MPPPAPDRSKLIRLLAALLLVGAVAWAFSPALSAAFVNWDDPVGIVENPQIRGLDGERLRWMATTTLLGPYQPLSWLTLALDHAVGGLDPRVYHRTSIILHALGAVAVFLFAARLYRSIPGTSAGDRACVLAAFFAAGFFALHPLRCESVCWVTERRDVLSGPLAFLSLYFWLGWARPAAQRGSRLSYGLALGTFALALLAKATTVAVPVFLVILDLWPLGRWRAIGWKRAASEKLPFVVLAGLISAVAVIGQQGANAVLPLYQHGVLSRAVVSCYAITFYVWKTIAPAGLSPIYTLPPEAVLRGAAYVLPAVAGIGLTVAAWLLRRRAPAVWFAWCAYLAALAPVCGLIQVGSQVAADRYTYVAALPLALLAGGGVLWCIARSGNAARFAIPAAALILVALGLAAHAQSRVWHDSESLWSQALRVDPKNPTANESLGDLLAKEAQATSDLPRKIALLQRAQPHLEVAATERPHPRRSYNLAIVLWLLSEVQPEQRPALLKAADTSLQQARDLAARARIQLQANYDLLAAHVSRGLGDLPRAARYADTAIRAVPGDLGARVLLGEVLTELKDPLAIDVLRGAETMAPADGVVRWRLAQALVLAGDSAAVRAKAGEARDLLVRSGAAADGRASVLKDVENYLAQLPGR